VEATISLRKKNTLSSNISFGYFSGKKFLGGELPVRGKGGKKWKKGTAVKIFNLVN